MKAKLFIIAAIILASFALQANGLVLSGNSYAQANCLHAVPMHLQMLNDSEEHQGIMLSASGDKAYWVQFAQPSIELDAGQSSEVIMFIKPDCGASDGNYQVRIYANDLQVSAITIDAKSASNVSVSIAPVSNEVKQCQSALYTITVLNSGLLEENVLVSVSGIPEEWLSFSRASAIIGPGSQKQMELKVQVPCNANVGLVPASVSVQYASSIASAGFSFNITGNQGVSVSLPEGIEACRENGTVISGKITNISSVGDSIALSVQGVEWAKPSPQNFAVAPGETRSFEIVVQKNNAEAKNYPLELIVKSTKFGSSQSKKFLVNLKECYSVDVKEEYAPRKACIGEKTKFAFMLTNNGQKDIEGIVSLSGAGVSVPQKKELIKAGDKRLEEFWLDFNKEKPGKKSLVFGFSSQHYSVDSNIGFVLEDCNKGTATVVAGTEKKPGFNPLSGLVTGVKNLGLKTIASIALGIIIVLVLAYLAIERKNTQKQDLGGIAREINGGSGDYPPAFQIKKRTSGKNRKKKSK